MSRIYESYFFVGFIVLIVSILIIDLLFIGRKTHVVTIKESAQRTGFWVAIAIILYFIILFYGDRIHSIKSFNDLQTITQKYTTHLDIKQLDYASALHLYRKNLAMEYITGYLLEYTLSLDNLFVILLILTSFHIPQKKYEVVLSWGILGAIILRFLFIFLGAAMLQKFQWLLVLLGVFLIYSALKIFFEPHKKPTINETDHPVVRFLSKWFKVYHGPGTTDKFFHKKGKSYFITTLFIVLVIVEFTDLIFAFDSIPAIFSVTRDPYIVFFSNIFAIIGLRSLFFLIIKFFHLFTYLKEGIAILLIFIGIKLVFHTWIDNIGFKNIYSLYLILIVITGSVILSLLFPRETKN
jgi:tellurite resistance protein TerC